MKNKKKKEILFNQRVGFCLLRYKLYYEILKIKKRKGREKGKKKNKKRVLLLICVYVNTETRSVYRVSVMYIVF